MNDPRKCIVNDVSLYLEYRTQRLNEEVDRFVVQLINQIYRDTRRYVEQLVKEKQAELAGGAVVGHIATR